MTHFKESATEQTVRPLARLTARTLSAEETAMVSGGDSWGHSNTGGFGDRDLYA